MADVILKNINKIYPNGFHAIYNANINIKDKEFIVLVGPSGCGKTTTLRMIAGLESITSGELYIGDSLVNDIMAKDRDIAMVFQNYALYPHMNVFDNMAFGLKMKKISKSEIIKRVNEAAKILHIEDLLDRKPKQLSGGQRQRVALGRAIVRNPKVFLFDEPLSNLDAKLRVSMRAELERLHHQLDATMIYVTHDQIEAMTMGDRIVVMNKGYIQQIDTPINLYNKPKNKFVAGFIGSPPMNFIDGKIIKVNDELVFSTSGIEISLNNEQKSKLINYLDKEVILGIRPEYISIKRDNNKGIKGEIDIIEHLGIQLVVYIKINEKNTLTIITGPDEKFTMNEQIYLDFRQDKMLFFEKKITLTENKGEEQKLIV